MQTNLLLDKDSFIWSNPNLDRSKSIDDFILSYNQAKDNEDKLWNHPDIWDDPDYPHFEKYLYSFDQLSSSLSWMSFENFQGLVQYFTYYSPTSNKSRKLSNLTAEFNAPDQLNGLIGIDSSLDNVYSIPSWHEFHCKFLTENNQYIDWSKHEYLPNLEYSNLCLIDEVKRKINSITNIIPDDLYGQVIKTMNDDERIAYSKKIGSIVAERNFYVYDEELSKLEGRLKKSNRDIYYTNKNNRYLYLSIDFESVAFEVCDHKGDHLGEYLFTGKFSKGSINKGPKDHGLRAVKNGILKR